MRFDCSRCGKLVLDIKGTDLLVQMRKGSKLYCSVCNERMEIADEMAGLAAEQSRDLHNEMPGFLKDIFR